MAMMTRVNDAMVQLPRRLTWQRMLHNTGKLQKEAPYLLATSAVGCCSFAANALNGMILFGTYDYSTRFLRKQVRQGEVEWGWWGE